MKKYFALIAVCVSSCFFSWGQSEAVSPVGSLNIVKDVKPAILEIDPSSIQFIDATGNNAINANEDCKIRFKITNKGNGEGLGCVAKITATGATAGLSYKSQTLPTIKIGETRTVEIPVTAGFGTVDGQVELAFEVTEPNGFGTDPHILTITTKAFEAPLVKVTDYTITSKDGAKLEKKKPFDLQILLQNTQYGLAEDVQVKVDFPIGVLLTDGSQNCNFDKLSSGETQSLNYSLIVNNNYTETTIPVKVTIKEKYGKYSENKVISLALNQTFASNKVDIVAKNEERKEITIVSLTSKVDKDIPKTSIKNDKTFAVIIANESYRQVSTVPFAQNDGNSFYKYCTNVLGIPERNIHHATNATLNEMKSHINWLKNIMASFGADATVVFYYAGHGIPSESDKSAYLLPVDGNGTDVTTGYKLDDLYGMLSASSGNSIVFLDACFSGSKREGGMIASARGVAIKAKTTLPQGNMVVFSAATGDETAYPYSDEQHGLFTYFLLEKLQATAGDVTLGELAKYIKTNVSRTAIVVNNKPQTPTITASGSLQANWESMKLR